MDFFGRRNQYIVEYSGHETISLALRQRLSKILSAFIGRSVYHGNRGSKLVEMSVFLHEVSMEFPGKDYVHLVGRGDFFEVFTVFEIFLSHMHEIEPTIRSKILDDAKAAFNLSGSVYEIMNNRHVGLRVDKDLAEKVESLKMILDPYPEFSDRFFQAVGNLYGRKARPEDVVKDIFISAEGYLKKITLASKFGDAIKELEKRSWISRAQRKVLEALHDFSSDSKGVRHAGEGIVPDEKAALWYLDTIIAQLRMIDRVSKAAQS